MEKENEKLILTPKRAKGEDGYKTFSIRIREELVEKINNISAKTGYSRNELIARFLDYAVDRCVIMEDKQNSTEE